MANNQSRTQKRSDAKNTVYYISLVASDRKGIPREEYFCFDLRKKIDLEGTDVQVLDCHDLLDNYNHQNRTLHENPTVYDLVEVMIQSNPHASYFIDECPFLVSCDPNICKNGIIPVNGK